MSRTVGIDSFSLIFRSFYAAQASKTEDPAVALNIFRRLLSGILPQLKPDYVLAACDPGGPTFRHRIADDYKAQRKPAPDSLREVIAGALDIMRDAGIPVISVPDFEADDVLATLAVRMREGHQLTVVSSDRDLVGLVSEHADLFLVGSGGQHRRFNLANASEVFGVAPPLVADYKALVGDSSDNICGVPGIGTKTALSLLLEHGDLETILSRVDELAPRVAAKFNEEGIAQARICQQLAALCEEVPVELDATAARWTPDKQVKLATVPAAA
jgi:DNA polymerase-1